MKNKKLCIDCKHSQKTCYGSLQCKRKDPKTGAPIEIPNSCETQRSNRFYGWLIGENFCGVNGKYFEEKENE